MPMYLPPRRYVGVTVPAQGSPWGRVANALGPFEGIHEEKASE